MQIIDNATFLSHARSQGLRLDDRYPEPRALNYQNDLRACIPLPTNIHDLKRTLHTTIALAAGNAPIYIYRRGGIWRFPIPPSPGPRATSIAALHYFCHTSGIPDNTPGTIRLEPHEIDFLFTLLLLNTLVSASMDYDLFLVPDHQNFGIYVDHDGDIIFQFRDEQTQSAVIPRLPPVLHTNPTPQ